MKCVHWTGPENAKRRYSNYIYKYCAFIQQYSRRFQPEPAIIWPAIPVIGAMVGEEDMVEANVAPSSPPGLAIV